MDIACGIGIFLSESFDFLLEFYQKNFPDFENPAKFIVENNLFGVDLDENAINICQNIFFEKSGIYSQNIRCGNSLISDKNSCEKAFFWEKELPDLVFLDVLMPGLSGPQVLAKMEKSKKCKVILMSAYLGEHNIDTARKMGADLFIQKPFEDIFEIIRIAEELVNGG